MSTHPAGAGPGSPDLPARTTARVEVMYRAERDVAAWERRHAAGEVPGRWPYGLDLLARPGVEVRAVPLSEPGRVRAARVAAVQTARHLARRVRPGSRGPAGTRAADLPGSVRELGIAWDENMARRMVRGAPRPEMAAGVIWLTDRLAADPGDARARAMLQVLRRTDALWVNSRAQVEPLAAAVGRYGPSVHFFPFGVDGDFFSATPWPERPMVLSVGGDRDRDPATLFAALEEVVRRSPGVEVLVQTRSDLTPPDGVRTVPHVPHRELRRLYRRATVVVVATRPNLHMSGLTVSLESMATARPIVLTRTPGAEDYVEDGVTGTLVPTQDPPRIAEAVLTLLSQPADAEQMGLRARSAVERSFTSHRMVSSLARVLDLDPTGGGVAR